MYRLVVYSMTGRMGTVTTGLSSSAWKKVRKEGYQGKGSQDRSTVVELLEA